MRSRSSGLGCPGNAGRTGATAGAEAVVVDWARPGLRQNAAAALKARTCRNFDIGMGVSGSSVDAQLRTRPDVRSTKRFRWLRRNCGGQDALVTPYSP